MNVLTVDLFPLNCVVITLSGQQKLNSFVLCMLGLILHVLLSWKENVIQDLHKEIQ